MEKIKTQGDNFSPSPVISKLNLDDKSVFVIRDDLLPGGTKQRAALPYIQELIDQGYKHFIYASPFSGFAQIALSYASYLLNVKCTIFCEQAPEGGFHEFSKKAQSYNANIILCKNLEEAHEKTLELQSQDSSSKVIPLGFNDNSFKKLLKEKIMAHWENIVKNYDVKELWLPIGSGTLLRTFQSFLSPDIKIVGVNVQVLKESDNRISSIKEDESVNYFKTEMPFGKPCTKTPPIPSNKYYDAKIFPFLKKAKDGAFWWNVAC